MIWIRWAFPVVMCLVGLVIIAAGGVSESSFDLGVPFIATGLCIGLLSYFWVLGVNGDKERNVEEDARAFFAEHGRWPTGAERTEFSERNAH